MAGEDPRVYVTREWLQKAQDDLGSASRLASAPPIASSVVFHCQQAAEQALKGFLAWHERPLRKTHELRELLAACGQSDQEFSSLEPAAQILTPFASESRYPGRPNPSVEQMDTAMRHAREVVAFVLARLPPEVQP